MASSKKPAQPRSTVPPHIEKSLSDIAENLARLTKRLVGDDELQTKGLINEVQDNAREAEKRFGEQDRINREVAETLGRLNSRMEGYEAFRSAQEAANKKFEDTSDRVDKTATLAIGGWKLIGIMATIVTTCSGGVAWIISTFGSK